MSQPTPASSNLNALYDSLESLLEVTVRAQSIALPGPGPRAADLTVMRAVLEGSLDAVVALLCALGETETLLTPLLDYIRQKRLCTPTLDAAECTTTAGSVTAETAAELVFTLAGQTAGIWSSAVEIEGVALNREELVASPDRWLRLCKFVDMGNHYARDAQNKLTVMLRRERTCVTSEGKAVKPPAVAVVESGDANGNVTNPKAPTAHVSASADSQSQDAATELQASPTGEPQDADYGSGQELQVSPAVVGGVQTKLVGGSDDGSHDDGLPQGSAAAVERVQKVGDEDAKYLFRNEGGVFRIRFDGESATIMTTGNLGARYVHAILQKPQIGYLPEELYRLVKRQAGVSEREAEEEYEINAGSKGASVRANTAEAEEERKDMERRLREVKLCLDRATQSDNAVDKDRYQSELKKSCGMIQSRGGTVKEIDGELCIEGRLRPVHESGNKAPAHSIAAALGEFRKKLTDTSSRGYAMPKFAAHLKHFITGRRYHPSDPTPEWKF